MNYGHAGQSKTLEFAHRRGIEVERDFEALGGSPMLVRLAWLDETGATQQHITKTGADYSFSQLDYISASDGRLLARRMVATILRCKRTELAYWTDTAPAKRLTVHKGIGTIAIGIPSDGSMRVFEIDSEETPTVALSPGRFYTIEATVSTPDRLVVSGLYGPDEPEVDELEIYVEPGQRTVETPEGVIEVPEAFRKRYMR